MVCFHPPTYHICGVIFYQDKITFPQRSEAGQCLGGRPAYRFRMSSEIHRKAFCGLIFFFFINNSEHWCKETHMQIKLDSLNNKVYLFRQILIFIRKR